jgi:hypothetical protein
MARLRQTLAHEVTYACESETILTALNAALPRCCMADRLFAWSISFTWCSFIDDRFHFFFFFFFFFRWHL